MRTQQRPRRQSMNASFASCMRSRFRRHDMEKRDVNLVAALPNGRAVGSVLYAGHHMTVLVEENEVFVVEDNYSRGKTQATPAGVLSRLRPLEAKPMSEVRRWQCNGRSCADRPTSCRHCFVVNDILPVLFAPREYDLFSLRELPVAEARIQKTQSPPARLTTQQTSPAPLA